MGAVKGMKEALCAEWNLSFSKQVFCLPDCYVENGLSLVIATFIDQTALLKCVDQKEVREMA